jgi:DNA modification methylase
LYAGVGVHLGDPLPAIPPPPGPAALIQGDARRLPFADETIDLVVTSPPFLNLRSYTDGGQPCEGQIGAGVERAEFLEQLWAATAELKRVLKPTGSIFVELGDSYTDKSLNLTPHRYAIGCVDRLGLTLRAEIIWDRPNGLPESVRDRVRRSHSCWFHLVKQPRYYSALDEIREPYENDGRPRGNRQGKSIAGNFPGRGPGALNMTGDANPLGKLPGSVWVVPSEPLRLPLELGIDHYAAFPSEWPRRLILGFSPPGVCMSCGEGRVPVVQREFHALRAPQNRNRRRHDAADDGIRGQQNLYNGPVTVAGENRTSILGYACACTPHTDHPGIGGSGGARYGDAVADGSGYPIVAPFGTGDGRTSLKHRPKVGGWREYHLTGWTPPPTRPAVVLDVFGGTGTTAMTARALGRFGISLDLSMDYCRAAAWRVWESPGVQKVRDRTWPPPPRPRRSRRSRQTAEGTQLTLLNPAG